MVQGDATIVITKAYGNKFWDAFLALTDNILITREILNWEKWDFDVNNLNKSSILKIFT